MKSFLMLLLSGLIFQTMLIAQETYPQWLRYSAISPDGKNIAFCYTGDIYIVDVNGGKARPLTSHSAYDFRPVWSPDSKTIAFASNRYGNFDIFVVSAEGGEPRRLSYHSAGDFPYCFSADGKSIFFSSYRMGTPQSILYPSGIYTQIYSVAVDGGREHFVSGLPAQELALSKDGNLLLYQDIKGYENEWRKHHSSSITRDIWQFNFKTGENKKMTVFDGEDRDPVWGNNGDWYYLSEKSGSFNIWKNSADGSKNEQLTTFDTHPVRFLSRSEDGTLCFSYDGFLYTLKEGDKPRKLEIAIAKDIKENKVRNLPVNGNCTEFEVSPNGKEIVFVSRGEVFVSSVEHGTTKRITSTPVMERSVSFSPDGKKVIYASERDGRWGIYETTIKRNNEKYFFASTLLEEKPLVKNDEENFQPLYSPDGKEVAFLSNRTTVKVMNLESKKTRTVMNGNLSFSYTDGDQYFVWSPDSKWLLVQYYPNDRWVAEIGLFDVNATDKHINLTQSGYSEGSPRWTLKGEAMLFQSDRNGYRSHGSWGAESDVFITFFTRKSWEKFSLSEEELDLIKESESADTTKKAKKEDKDEKTKKDEKVTIPSFELDRLADRTQRLTINSSDISDFYLKNDGSKLYYLARFEKGYDLWVHDFRKEETKILVKLGGSPSNLIIDPKEENAFLLNGGNPVRINLSSGEQKRLTADDDMTLDYAAEREYMFEHVWREMYEKFYVKDFHGVDWQKYKEEYKKYLPWITEKIDFAEMLSEMLGEVNASHTGAHAYMGIANPDATANLGIYTDENYTGDGIKISEVLAANRVFAVDSKIKAGTVIEKIDGEAITSDINYFPLLNRKAGKRVLLNLYNPDSKERWEEVVKPVSNSEISELLYNRWVERQEELVTRLSKGRIGYVHVESMSSSSFREVYKNMLGKYAQAEAIVVDTRFNGGGWLHDDLATLLSGTRYLTLSPRGQKTLGGEPLFKWSKPSIVLMGEANYSDAHIFPYVYKELKIGKLVGMPVPGTGTAVWWESLIDPSVIFGIPQVGLLGNDGKLLENTQLEPDIKVLLPNTEALKGQDAQTETAVKELLRQLDEK